MTTFESLPPERRTDAERALADAFPDAKVKLGERLAGGSALGVFRFEANGAAYVLRVERPADPLRDAARQLACARIAAAGEITPELILSDPDARLSIQRFIPTVQRPWSERLAETARLVRRMHSLPLFPAYEPYSQTMAGLFALFAQSRLFPPDVHVRLASAAKIALSVYPWDDGLVSSHNDLNPSNVVFDGSRSWIMDWETAFAADRYIDIATLANWLTADDLAAQTILEAYFDAPPTPVQQARFYMMRQINRLFYGAMMSLSVRWAGSDLTVSGAEWEAAPGLNAIRGEMSALAVYSGRLRFGAAFLKDALAGIAADEFAKAADVLRS